MRLREANRNYNIPTSTLKRRLTKKNFKKIGPSVLGKENKNKLKLHIQKLQKLDFVPTRDCVREIPYKLAEQFKIKHTFNKEKRMPRYD